MKTLEKENGRIKWLDVLKGICILFVMLNHSYPPELYRRIFTPFFLTMFFFASGYTFSVKNSFREFLYGKFFHLCIPLFVFGSIRILGMSFLTKEAIGPKFLGLFLQINCKNDELWFLSCLFSVNILFYILYNISRKISLKYGTYLIFAISLLLSVIGYADILFFHFHIIWEMELAFVMQFYFMLGFFFNEKHELKSKIAALFRDRKIYSNIVWNCILVAGYFALIMLVNNSVDIHKEEFQYPALFIIASLLIIYPIINISMIIANSKAFSVFSFLGKNSLFYFAFSGIVREILLKVLPVSFNPYVESLVSVLAMSIVLVLPALFTRKYLPFLMGVKKS